VSPERKQGFRDEITEGEREKKTKKKKEKKEKKRKNSSDHIPFEHLLALI
jgi:hypothetical protein